MAWTATFKRYDADNNVIWVDFSDGTMTISREFHPPPDLSNLGAAAAWFKVEARRVIGVLTTKDTLETAIPDTDVTPNPDPTPDPDNSLVQQFSDALFAIKQLDKAIALPITTGGALTTLQNARATQLSDLQALYNAQSAAVKTKIIARLP